MKIAIVMAIALGLSGCSTGGFLDGFSTAADLVAKGRALEADGVKKLADAFELYCKNIPEEIRGYVRDSINGVLDNRGSGYRAGTLCIKAE